MGLIFGVYYKSGEAVNANMFKRTMESLAKQEPDINDYWIERNLAFGTKKVDENQGGIRSNSYSFDEDKHYYIVGDCRIDYKEELAHVLDEPLTKIEQIPDSKIILLAYLKFGTDCVQYLYGDFAFAIWDERKQSVFCGRDHFGCIPFYYIDSDEYFVFSTDLKAFEYFLENSRNSNEEYLVDCLLGIAPNSNKTSIDSVLRLPSSNTLLIYSDSKTQQNRYWDLRHKYDFSKISQEEAINGLERCFYNAVNERCKGSKSIGAELSGGLDSSSITAIASLISKDLGIPIFTFTHVLNSAQPQDHIPYKHQIEVVKKIGKLFSIDQQVFISGDNDMDVIQALQEGLKLHNGPINFGMDVMGRQLLDQVKKREVNTLLSGFGGDECITSPGDGLLNELVLQNRYKILKQQIRFKVNEYGGNYYRILIKVIAFTWLPVLNHFRSFNYQFRGILAKRYKSTALQKKLEKLYEAKKRFFKANTIPNDNYVNRRIYERLRGSHISIRLEESYAGAKIRNIEYRYPFLDVKLIEYYYSLPSAYKNNLGFGRWVFRKSMEKILPSEICWRKRKTDPVMPYVSYLLKQDKLGIEKIINYSRNNFEYHYVDYDKLLWVADQLHMKGEGKQVRFGSRAFINSIAILILQKWQREGKIDIGIKC